MAPEGKEYLDDPRVSGPVLERNLKEIELINTWLGGHSATLKGMDRLKDTFPVGRPLRILELGCGGGDNLRVIEKWGKKKGINLHLEGWDFNPHVVNFAQKQAQKNGSGPVFKQKDFLNTNWKEEESFDIILLALVCHHLSKHENIRLLKNLSFKASQGIIINDLQKHPVPYYFISMFTKLPFFSAYVKNDAPLSVKRGFSKPAIKEICHRAELKCEVKWIWAFRWLGVIKP